MFRVVHQEQLAIHVGVIIPSSSETVIPPGLQKTKSTVFSDFVPIITRNKQTISLPPLGEKHRPFKRSDVEVWNHSPLTSASLPHTYCSNLYWHNKCQVIKLLILCSGAFWWQQPRDLCVLVSPEAKSHGRQLRAREQNKQLIFFPCKKMIETDQQGSFQNGSLSYVHCSKCNLEILSFSQLHCVSFLQVW